MDFKQTWWNDNVEKKIDQFNVWVGDENASTKRYSRQYIYSQGYKSIADLGCTNASMYVGFQKESYDYTGIDSCVYFVNKNKEI